MWKDDAMMPSSLCAARSIGGGGSLSVAAKKRICSCLFVVAKHSNMYRTSLGVEIIVISV